MEVQSQSQEENRILDHYSRFMGEEWAQLLGPFLTSDRMRDIEEAVRDEYDKYEVYPDKTNVFNAFALTKPENVKVVMLGMDPYNKPYQALGVSFGVNDRFTNVPGSLKIIDEEIGIERGGHQLTGLAEQGVLLLNAALTVRRDDPGSHMKLWQQFTEYVIMELSYQEPIFFLMGRKAQWYSGIIKDQNLVVNRPHPAAEMYSGRKAGFLGSDPFTEINEKLTERHREKIDWSKGDSPDIDLKP